MLNVNGLNTQIKKQRLLESIKKKKNMCLLDENHLKYKKTDKFKINA